MHNWFAPLLSTFVHDQCILIAIVLDCGLIDALLFVWRSDCITSLLACLDFPFVNNCASLSRDRASKCI